MNTQFYKNTVLCTVLMSLLLLVTSTHTHAQNSGTATSESEIWAAVKFKYKLNKKWEIGLQEQYRYSRTSGVTDAYFTEFSTAYAINKHFSTGVAMRYIRKNDIVGKKQGFENHVRFQVDLDYQHKLNRWEVFSRLRYQTKNELGVSQADGDYPNNHLRLKAGLGYNIKKWKLDPEFSAEIFRHYEKDIENGFDKMRYTIGTNYSTKSIGKFGLFYRIENELNETDPVNTSVLGLKYSYTLKRKSKK